MAATGWSSRTLCNGVASFGPWLAELGMAEAMWLSDRAAGFAFQRGEMRIAELATAAPFGWLSRMTAVRLSGGGCLAYSPVLHPDGDEALCAALEEADMLPVRVVVAPCPSHHLAVKDWQRLFPDARYVCGDGSEQRAGLRTKRPDLRWDVSLPSESAAGAELLSDFDWVCIADNRSCEIVMHHKNSRTLLAADLLYKADGDCCQGPGGPSHAYTHPEWHATAQQEMFYDTSPSRILPTYRMNPEACVDEGGMQRSLDTVLAWPFERASLCHTDPLSGDEARELLRLSWAWLGTAAAA